MARTGYSQSAGRGKIETSQKGQSLHSPFRRNNRLRGKEYGSAMGRYYEGAKLVRKTRRNSKTGKTERSKNYFLRYKDARTGKPVYESTGTGDIQEAQTILEEKLSEIRVGELGINLPSYAISIAQVLKDYMHFQLDDDSLERTTFGVSPILIFWQDQPVSAVNKEAVKAYTKQQRKLGLSNGTIRRDLGILKAAIGHAQEMERLGHYNFPTKQLPPKGKPRSRFLYRFELVALHKAARQEPRTRFSLRLFLVIGYHCGARKSAIMDLKWDQIDFTRNFIDFGYSSDGEHGEGTNKRRQKIEIPPVVRSLLIRRLKRYGEGCGYVFHQKKNPNRRVKSINKGFRTAVKKLGFVDVVPHTLRHTKVTELMQAGYTVKEIEQYMAMSPETILNVYAHPSENAVSEISKSSGRSLKVREINEKAREKAKEEAEIRNVIQKKGNENNAIKN